ncbi:MAG: serine protein kinase PrkA [Myxococcota bacterium]
MRDRFEAQRRVLSFTEYLALLSEVPERHTRDASRYLRDCFDHYGTEWVDRPVGRARRFKLFDLEFLDDDDRRAHLIGQEELQRAFYQVLQNFVREGRSNRLILLHGPNGSAKTTFSASLMRGMEHYSSTDEGALYCFSWIFPRGRDGKTIGFGSSDDGSSRSSFAHLPEAQIDARLGSELREHPLLLLPVPERQRLFETVGVAGVPEWIRYGELSLKNQKVFDALLTAYRGDLSRVLHHVRIERYYLSRRYRVGAVTIGPQMAVDASERQITADRSLSSLPASLSSLTLFEVYGDLVDASGGVIEYSDLLKRPLDAWKYLLLAIENGEVPLSFSNIHLNAVLIASSNEVHLRAFQEHHEYNSFRGRLQLVRVPYLLNVAQEQSIYDTQIAPQVRRHVAPHATYVAALWAILTRLRRAHADRLPGQLGKLAADLTPLEKAELYADGRIPARLSAEDARELRAGIEAIYGESDSLADYEGLTGASPREIRAMLLEAANDDEYECLSPLAVLKRIEAFCRRDDYEFLKQTPDRGYYDHRAFVGHVRNRWLDRVDEELRTSTGLIEETQYRKLFDDYVSHVSYWVKKEKIYNEVTGKYEDPDADLLSRVEDQLEVDPDTAEDFRRNLISTVAAYAIDHPGEDVEYGRLFPRYIDRLREAYFGQRKKQIQQIAEDVLVILDERDPGT